MIGKRVKVIKLDKNIKVNYEEFLNREGIVVTSGIGNKNGRELFLVDFEDYPARVPFYREEIKIIE